MTPLSIPNCPPSILRHADDNPRMENGVHTRIRQVLARRGISAEAASVEAGLDRGYLRKLFDRPNASPRGETLSRLARSLDVSVAWLLHGDVPASAIGAETGRTQQHLPAPNPVDLPVRTDMPRDVPVYGTAAGSHLRGAFQIFGGVVDYVRRPPTLAAAKMVYALYVEGESMVPQYFPGDLIFINPAKPARFGDAVIAQMRNGPHEPVEATLGIYEGRTPDRIMLGKRNPPGTRVDLSRERVIEIHKVLTNNEIYGV